MVLTYNQIMSKLKTFANEHYQINSFDNGDLWELIEHAKRDGVKDQNYPMMFVQDQPATTEQGIIELVFRIYIINLVQKDESNENEVKSDTLQICLDVLSEWVMQTTDLQVTVDKNTNLTSFTERFNDELTGWWMDLKLKVPFKYNKCDIPKAN